MCARFHARAVTRSSTPTRWAHRCAPSGIDYVPLGELGGLRKPLPDSPNTGWRNESFRGYADYMQTERFAHGLEHLIELAGERRTAIMCAEAVPWRCHRSLVADALAARGIGVVEILSETSYRDHALTRVRARRGHCRHLSARADPLL